MHCVYVRGHFLPILIPLSSHINERFLLRIDIIDPLGRPSVMARRDHYLHYPYVHPKNQAKQRIIHERMYVRTDVRSPPPNIMIQFKI